VERMACGGNALAGYGLLRGVQVVRTGGKSTVSGSAFSPVERSRCFPVRCQSILRWLRLLESCTGSL